MNSLIAATNASLEGTTAAGLAGMNAAAELEVLLAAIVFDGLQKGGVVCDARLAAAGFGQPIIGDGVPAAGSLCADSKTYLRVTRGHLEWRLHQDCAGVLFPAASPGEIPDALVQVVDRVSNAGRCAPGATFQVNVCVSGEDGRIAVDSVEGPHGLDAKSEDWIKVLRGDSYPIATVLVDAPFPEDTVIRCCSCQGNNAVDFYSQAFAWAAKTTGLNLVDVGMDRACEIGVANAVRDGTTDVAFLCGIQAAEAVVDHADVLSMSVAPVHGSVSPHAAYYSHIMVAADSPYQSLEDLRGTRFGYNETCSWSGFSNLLSYFAGVQDMPLGDFFSQVTMRGSHKQSLEDLLSSTIDAASVDAVVWAMEVQQHPEIECRYRKIPGVDWSSGKVVWPMPPALVSRRLPISVRSRLSDAFSAMHRDTEGLSILQRHGFLRFDGVTVAGYRCFVDAMAIVRSVDARPCDAPSPCRE